ncbi:asparaginase [Pararhizobium sp. BT-229]|uniref:asparaginase n=1 Tax=Pararhizobium sp. BT-229 TaxID=2986923 RepID=UPI0021F7CCEF|nr:asparaginase [Pararhizobium sp. BT-229]MCV9967764.1 asparaginase [Pararhizobium sp. BT-229]
MLPKIAYVGTGGTIASIGKGPFDLLDYNATDERIEAKAFIERTGLQGTIADIVAVNFRQIDSTAITLSDWADLADLCKELARDPDLNGIVIGHGTASLEETAWLLSLVLDLEVPVVVTGSMRPLTGISSDTQANLAAAIRVAAMPRGEIAGVSVVLNDEVHSPRAVTKSHTLRLNAFQSPWFGPLGFVDGPNVNLVRRHRSVSERCFTTNLLRRLPRVDIAYSYVGADGVAIRAFVEAGAKGIVSAGFGPGNGTPAEVNALVDAVSSGVIVVQSTRMGAGVAVDSAYHKSIGIIAGNDLNAQKARILLALCLARGDGHQQIADIFYSA